MSSAPPTTYLAMVSEILEALRSEYGTTLTFRPSEAAQILACSLPAIHSYDGKVVNLPRLCGRRVLTAEHLLTIARYRDAVRERSKRPRAMPQRIPFRVRLNPRAFDDGSR